MTYCPKWGSRNEREPFDEQASTPGDVHQAVQESGRPPYALHTTWGSRGLREGGKGESALSSHRAPTEVVQQGSRPTCVPAATLSSSAWTPSSPSVVWVQVQLPAWGRPGPALHGPAEQPRSLGFSALVFTSRARKQLSGQDASREAALGLIKACQHSALLGPPPHSFFPVPRVHQGCAWQWWVSRPGPEGACGHACWETRGSDR